jgi:hypothetical protein
VSPPGPSGDALADAARPATPDRIHTQSAAHLTNEPLDDFLPIKKPKKKKPSKKRKGSKSVVDPDETRDLETAQEQQQRPEAELGQDTRGSERLVETPVDMHAHGTMAAATTTTNGITSQQPATIAENNTPEPPPSPPLSQKHAPISTATPNPSPPTDTDTTATIEEQTSKAQPLTTHAKLYSLSAKYGMAELQSLALTKFQEGAETSWDPADFVHAAGEVYSSPLLLEENHADMRRAVTGLVFGHRELLGRDGMREILRGELALDLLFRMREEGVW